MIQSLFESLNAALSASTGMAMLASFVWGVLSILLSPCHLASIPLIVGFIHGQGRISPLRAFVLAGLFALGILLTIAAIGVMTTAAGRMAGDVGPWACYGVAVIFFIVGLHLMDVVPLPLPGPATVAMQRRGLLAALMLGLIFGIALGPCTFAYMAPVLGVTFTLGSSRPVLAAALLLLYGIGHCAVIVAAGSASGCVQRYLDWNQRKGAIIWVRRACGALVIVGGWWMIYTAP
ncbi:MAG: cytochrome C biogenesis protein [Phycisphaeraceae bacterium]|nr:cytochrome C biogenesis protein [Phycisphaeraceae bacterium]